MATKSLILTLCVIGLAVAEKSPVFLWGVNSEARPSLTTVSQSEFAELVTPVLADKTLIVFLENGLTNKDFLCSNAEKSCFARLQDVSGKSYYTSVENPIETLHSLSAVREFNTVNINGQLTNPLEISKGKIVFVNFEEKNSIERSATLESHDIFIASITSNFGKDVVYMYTAAPSTSVAAKRQRRATETASGFVFRNGANFLLYFTSLNVVDSSGTTTSLSISSMEYVDKNSTFFSVTLNAENAEKLSFDIFTQGGYFYMSNLVYKDVIFYTNDVYSPTDFSYFCGNLVLDSLTSSAYSLEWNSVQFQAPFNYTTNATFVFSDPWHCVGFFTGGILSGLLVVALLLSITFIGVCWMMDINTMDRFDDPKGKTITINASE